jgi:hydrogenase maturation factor HypF (carbamoyltransferase family)
VRFPLVTCRECGAGFTTREHLDYLRKRAPLPEYIYELCEGCKRRFYMEKTLSLGHM